LYLALLDELNGLANLVLAGNCRGFGRGIEFGVRFVDLGNSRPLGLAEINIVESDHFMVALHGVVIHYPCMNAKPVGLGATIVKICFVLL
jgi:hypothetical protein